MASGYSSFVWVVREISSLPEEDCFCIDHVLTLAAACEVDDEIPEIPPRVNQRCVQVWKGVFNTVGGISSVHPVDAIIWMITDWQMASAKKQLQDFLYQWPWTVTTASKLDLIERISAGRAKNDNLILIFRDKPRQMFSPLFFFFLHLFFISLLTTFAELLWHNLCARAAADCLLSQWIPSLDLSHICSFSLKLLLFFFNTVWSSNSQGGGEGSIRFQTCVGGGDN